MNIYSLLNFKKINHRAEEVESILSGVEVCGDIYNLKAIFSLSLHPFDYAQGEDFCSGFRL